MEYTGPIPTTPKSDSSDEVWHQWWTYQTILQNIRYENEREARNLVLDRQHAEKMAAEAACAASNNALAAAQQAAAASLASQLPTKGDLVFSILRDHPQATILTNAQLVDGCKGIVDAFVAKFPGSVRA